MTPRTIPSFQGGQFQTLHSFLRAPLNASLIHFDMVYPTGCPFRGPGHPQTLQFISSGDPQTLHSLNHLVYLSHQVIWVWLTIKQEGQTAGFGTHVSTSQGKFHFGVTRFFVQPRPYLQVAINQRRRLIGRGHRKSSPRRRCPAAFGSAPGIGESVFGTSTRRDFREKTFGEGGGRGGGGRGFTRKRGGGGEQTCCFCCC